MSGWGHMKAPPMPEFHGGDGVTPKSVLTFLTTMQLATGHLQNQVGYIAMHLKGTAAEWRDTVFLAKHSGLLEHGAIIPMKTFRKEFIARFIDQPTCMQVRADFETKFKIRKTQSVQAYVELFNQKIEELNQLPFVKPPDQLKLCEIFISGLAPNADLSDAVQKGADPSKLNDLKYFIKRAKSCEAVLKMWSLRSTADTKTTDKSQKRKGVSSNTFQTGSLGSEGQPQVTKKNKKQQAQAKPQGSPQGGKGNAQPQVPRMEQHADHPKCRGKPYPSQQLRELHLASRLDVKGPDGVMYPNEAYRKYANRHCRVNNLCFWCFKGTDVHKPGECKNPEVRHKLSDQSRPHALPSSQNKRHERTLHVQAMGTVPAQAQIGQNRDASVHHTVVSAVVAAQPYQQVTMAFVGAVQSELQKARGVTVLVDTGSTHNVIRPGLCTQQAHTGKTYEVFRAGSQIPTIAQERRQCVVTVQGVTTAFDACEVELPEGIDILLGQNWQHEHKATLLTWQGQVNFLDDKGLPAIWSKSGLKSSMRQHPYNSPFKWSSAATVGRSKKYYVAFVRSQEDMPADLPGTLNAAAVATEIDQGHRANDAEMQVDQHLQDVFVEQQSTVQGIRELVQQFKMVFPEDMPAGLPPDRGIRHTISMPTDHVPPASRVYRLSKPQREEMEQQIQSLLKSWSWIRPSSSPYAPFFL